MFYLTVTYFQFQFPLVVCFYTMPDQRELLTSASSIRNDRQRIIFQYAINANELCRPTYAPPGSMPSQDMYHMRISRPQEFIGNKHMNKFTHSLTHSHTLNFISTGTLQI